MRKVQLVLAGLVLIVAGPAFAQIFSTVRGVVSDPRHDPIAGVIVTITSRRADWTRSTSSDANGAFQMPAVPVGDYTVTFASQGFRTVERAITVVSNTTVVLNVALELPGVQETVTVTGAGDEHPLSVTPTTLVDRRDIQYTPGASRTNSLEAITAYVPGAYVTHDQLHLRGGHQVTWLIDGVAVPNTNIASNVGPQIDPKDIDELEVQRGGYDAKYGDRTYGVFNVVPRTGFERNNDAELVVSAGNFMQTNNQASVGGHTRRFAYFASATGNRSDLGLGTPVAEVLHDRQTGFGGFGSFIVNFSPSDQLRVVTSARRDDYQIPNSPEDQAAGIDDTERESDVFAKASWVRTFPSGTVLTVSPFYHSNSANFEGGPIDPITTTTARRSRYGGVQAALSGATAGNSWEVGFYGFQQADDQLFGVTFNDGSNPNLSEGQRSSGRLVAVSIQDKVSPTSWLTVTGGVRFTHFAGSITEDDASPRIGASVQLPVIHWVARGFYGRFYQAPPLVTTSGPLLEFVTAQGLGFIPLQGERDEEYQVGLMVPLRGWTLDADRFQTRATNFFDHNPVGNSNVFFPITIEGALIRGTEVTVRSPRTWLRGQFHLAYAYQTAEGHGSISGGLTDFSSEGGTFLLDHDQRHTFSAGFDARLPWELLAATNVYYGSGFTDSGGPDHLPGHTTLNLSVGKSFGEKLSFSVTALNVLNSHLLIDNSLTFGGVHFNSPRELYAELRFRFHY